MDFLLKLPNISYCAEILIALLLYWLPTEKRDHALARFALSIPLLLGESLWVGPLLQRYGIHLWFFVVAATLYGICLFSTKLSPWETLYCLSCAYLTQHFASSLTLFLVQMGWLQADSALLPLLYGGLYLLVYAVFYLLFARGIPENGHYAISTEYAVLNALLTLAVVYYLSIFTRRLADFLNVDTEAASYQIMLGICQIYAMIVCLLMLSVQKLHRNELHAWRTLETSKAIWSQRKQQYEFSRENLDLMNRRLHDMKHQLAAIAQMESGSAQKGAYVRELENLIHTADTYADTGNEALDTILTEKGLYCSSHGIQWICVADGSFLGFVDLMDLYTLMGNALDNATESVEKADEPEKRFISVSIRRERGFALIQIKNHMEGSLVFQNGLPRTSKRDTAIHGIGLQSIRGIAERYHGTMTVTAENGIFTLTVLLPLEEAASA